MAANNPGKILSLNSSTNGDVILKGVTYDDSGLTKIKQPLTSITFSDVDIVKVGTPRTEASVDDNSKATYYWNSVDFTWSENRNTQGSISGNLKFTPQYKSGNAATYEGENIAITASGLNYTPTSNEKSPRYDDVQIKVVIPANMSTYDFKGGTYTFYTDMIAHDNKFDATSGLYQNCYNEPDPTGIVEFRSQSNGLEFIKSDAASTIQKYNYDKNRFEEIIAKVGPNKPFIKYGDTFGSLTVSGDDINKNESLPSKHRWEYRANNNGGAFTTSLSDKSHATVESRTLKATYTFIKYNSSDTSQNTGILSINQNGGSIEAKDPSISYDWTLSFVDAPSSTAKVADYLNMEIVSTKVTATRPDDGKTQKFSYNNICKLTPTTANDGKNAEMNVNIDLKTIGQITGDGDEQGDAKIPINATIINGSNSRNMNFHLVCKTKTEYTENDNISPNLVTKDIELPASKWIENPYVNMKLTTSYIPGEAGLSKPEYIKDDLTISFDNDIFNKEIEYVIKNNGKYTFPLIYKFPKNDPTTTGQSQASGNIETPSFSYLSNGSNVNCDFSKDLIYNPDTYTYQVSLSDKDIEYPGRQTPAVPDINWRITATTTDSGFDGSVKFKDNVDYINVKQNGKEAVTSGFIEVEYTVTLPNFAKFTKDYNKDGDTSYTAKFKKGDGNSKTTITPQFKFKPNNRNLSYWVNTYETKDVNKVRFKPRYDVLPSNREGNITIKNKTENVGIDNVTPSNVDGISTFTQKIKQLVEPLKGKIKAKLTNAKINDSNNVDLNWETDYDIVYNQPQEPDYSNVNFSFERLDNENTHIAPETSSINGKVNAYSIKGTGGSNITASCEFTLSETGYDNIKYGKKDGENSAYTFENIILATEPLTYYAYVDYSINNGSYNSVDIDENGNFTINIGTNTGGGVKIDNIELNGSNLFSEPFTIYASEGTATDKNIIVRVGKCTHDENGNVESESITILDTKTLQQPTTTTGDLVQEFIVGTTNCRIDPSCKLSVVIKKTDFVNGQYVVTGPKIKRTDIITTNDITNKYWIGNILSEDDGFVDYLPGNTGITSIQGYEKTISFFDIEDGRKYNWDIYNSDNPVFNINPGLFNDTNNNPQILNGVKLKYKYNINIHPVGYDSLIYDTKKDSGFQENNIAKNGIINNCEAQYKVGTNNMVNITNSLSVGYKFTNMEDRSNKDKKYIVNGLVRVIRNDIVLINKEAESTLTVAKVEYINVGVDNTGGDISNKTELIINNIIVTNLNAILISNKVTSGRTTFNVTVPLGCEVHITDNSNCNRGVTIVGIEPRRFNSTTITSQTQTITVNCKYQPAEETEVSCIAAMVTITLKAKNDSNYIGEVSKNVKVADDYGIAD